MDALSITRSWKSMAWHGCSTACLDELVDFDLVPQERIHAPKQALFRVVAMLTAMIRSLESRAGPDMSR